MCMVNDIIEELLDVNMEPSTSHCGGQVYTNTRRWGPCVWGTWTERGIFLFCEVFWCNVIPFSTGLGRNFKAPNAPCARAWEGGGAMAAKCERVHTYWPWSGAMMNKVRAWEANVLRLSFRLRMGPDKTWWTTEQERHCFWNIWKKMCLTLLTEKIANRIWTTMTQAVHDGDVPIMLALRAVLG